MCVTIAVGTRPMWLVSGRHPGRDEHRVEPAADLVGAVVGAEAVGGLQREGVLDRDEVEQAALGLAGPGRPSSRR